MAHRSLLGRRAILFGLCCLAWLTGCVSTGSMPNVKVVAQDGVVRSWPDCAEIVGDAQEIGVAGLVRAEDGSPVPKAELYFEDGSAGVATLGAWRRVSSDDMENLLHADSRGRFLIPYDRVAQVKGVATLSASKHGFRSATASWTLPGPVCLEMVLTPTSNPGSRP